MTDQIWPELGCGVGLRNVHYDFITKNWPKMDWFEVVSENFMDTGGRPLTILESVREHYPIVLHGTSLSIGSSDPLNQKYLTRLKSLIDRIEPALVSDHLCWCGVDNEALFDLLPLPFTEEALKEVVLKVEQLQNFLGRQFLLENVSTYLTYQHSTIPEWEFLTEVARRSGCGILLDLNNIYVNSFNHGFDPVEFINSIPGDLIGYFHLAGHTDKGKYLFDTHIGPVIDPVWDLYRKALEKWGKVNTLIEWDESIPEFSELEREAKRAKEIYEKASPRKASPIELEGATYNDEKGPTLLETQRWLKSYIRPEKDKEATERILLNQQGGEPGENRLEVYTEGYMARTFESLGEVFEAVKHLLGEGNFQKLSELYAGNYGSSDYNLSQRGEFFPKFVSETKVLVEKFPFMPDLALFEWQISRAFHAFDEKPFNPEALKDILEEQFETLKVSFQPSVLLISSRWPVFDLWKTRRTPVKQINLQVENRPQRVLIFRQGGKVMCELVKPSEFFVLTGLMQGETLGSLCGKLAENSEETPPLQEWFSKWVSRGLIKNCQFEKTNV